MSYDNWKTTEPAEKYIRRCPKRFGEEIDIRLCLDECPGCGADLRDNEPDPDALYDAWRDRQMEKDL